MADQNLTGLNNISAANAVDADELYIFDASETGIARSKSITVAELKLLTAKTDSEIKTSYENNSNTNAFTDTEKTKLSGIETGAEVNSVDSVNSQTGSVTIDADNIDDTSTTHKFVTSGDLTTLSNTLSLIHI